ncbi:MAG TPA: hypothetical protein VJK03_03690 [Candidatus Nanoarchaeia archaeon]|nr:hypothetical protein [Candidatus Nanoarchaeia archaeon]
MKYLALIVALLGISTLAIVLNETPPLPISSPSQLSSMLPNTKVSLQGTVTNEKAITNGKLLVLNNITIVCNCKNAPYLQNKNISILATVQKYNGKTELEVLKLKILE